MHAHKNYANTSPQTQGVAPKVPTPPNTVRKRVVYIKKPFRKDPAYQIIKILWPEKFFVYFAIAMGVPYFTSRHWIYYGTTPAHKRQMLAALMQAHERKCARIRHDLIKEAPPPHHAVKNTRGIVAQRRKTKNVNESITDTELK